MTLDAGIHFDVHEGVYHADPAPEPSLSASGAKVLLNRSPLAFQWQHARLRPAHLPLVEPKPEDATTAGTICHKLVLGRGKEVVVVDGAAWNTKVLKEERAAIHAAGNIAVLAHKFVEIEQAAGYLQKRVSYTAETTTEVVLIWEDHATDGTPVWCRAMIDAWPEPTRIDDLKLTAGELSEAFVARQIASMSYDLSMAWYRRGLSALRRDLAGRIGTRLIFAERKEPYDVFPVDLTEGDLHVADRKCQAAIDIFANCRRENRWPGVAPQPRTVVLPPWHERAWLEREMAEEAA
jgi:hypothetical protein